MEIYIIWLLMCINIISLYLWIRNDNVANNNIKTYIANEVAFTRQLRKAADIIKELQNKGE